MVSEHDLPNDEFEFYARLWAANDRLLQAMRTLEEEHSLHPDLLDAVEDAIRDDDRGAFYEAAADFFEALPPDVQAE